MKFAGRVKRMASGSWAELLQRTDVRVVLIIATLTIVCALGYYIVCKVRDSAKESDASTSDVLASFRDLHDEGELSDEEFRSIKAKLSSRLQQELKQPRNKDASS